MFKLEGLWRQSGETEAQGGEIPHPRPVAHRLHQDQGQSSVNQTKCRKLGLLGYRFILQSTPGAGQLRKLKQLRLHEIQPLPHLHLRWPNSS